MPFGSQGLSSAASLDFFDNLPPLESPKHPAASQQSLFEGLKELSSSAAASRLYRLVLLDAEGRPSGYPSEHDLARIIEGKPLPETPAAPKGEQQQSQQQQEAPKEPSFQELLAETHKKGGPVCAHCGATESPQWRRGPPHKAILCNACGTRYRRTNQLGSTVPSNQRKRAAAQMQAQQKQAAAAAAAAQKQQQAQHCSSEALKGHQGPVAKQPRIVA